MSRKRTHFTRYIDLPNVKEKDCAEIVRSVAYTGNIIDIDIFPSIVSQDCYDIITLLNNKVTYYTSNQCSKYFIEVDKKLLKESFANMFIYKTVDGRRLLWINPNFENVSESMLSPSIESLKSYMRGLLRWAVAKYQISYLLQKSKDLQNLLFILTIKNMIIYKDLNIIINVKELGRKYINLAGLVFGTAQYKSPVIFTDFEETEHRYRIHFDIIIPPALKILIRTLHPFHIHKLRKFILSLLAIAVASLNYHEEIGRAVVPVGHKQGRFLPNSSGQQIKICVGEELGFRDIIRYAEEALHLSCI